MRIKQVELCLAVEAGVGKARRTAGMSDAI